MPKTTPQINHHARELASRESDGVKVVLLWQPRDDAVTLAVSDSRSGDRFELPIRSDRALEAFYHPFVYAAVNPFGPDGVTGAMDRVASSDLYARNHKEAA